MFQNLAAHLLIAAVSALEPAVAGGGVQVRASVPFTEARLGQAIAVTVTLTNNSDESVLLVVRDANFTIQIESEAAKQLVRSPRYTRPVGRFADDQVPLRPGAFYGLTLPIQLNDLDATLGEGWIAQPGTYSLHVVYDSGGSARPAREPAWSGTAFSNPVDIHIRPVADEERNHRLSALRACLTSSCNTVPLANFYRVIHDETAAALLPSVLQRSPYDIWLLDAIVFQGRAEDVPKLRDLASRVSDETIKRQYLDAATLLSKRTSDRSTAGRRRERKLE